MRFHYNTTPDQTVEFLRDSAIRSNAGPLVINELPRIKLGLAVKWAFKSGAYLGGAYLGGADLRGVYLGGAYLGGAYLGDQWIIQGAVRSDGYVFILTNLKDEGVRLIAGCRNFTLLEARAHWKETRGGTPLGAETFAILDCLESMAKARGLNLDEKES